MPASRLSSVPGPSQGSSPSLSPPPSSQFPEPRDVELVTAARRVLEGALSVTAGDDVLVMVDRARLDLAGVLVDTARGLGARARVVVLEEYAPRPLRAIPPVLAAAIATANATILLASLEDGELAFRKEILALAGDHKIRHAHMIGVTRRAMIAGLAVDPSRILRATRAVRSRLHPDAVLRLRTPAGSNLVVRLDPKAPWIEQVGVIRPGRWENVPSGELVTVPLDVSGVFVADGSVGASFGIATGILDRRPVHVEIEGGVCKRVRCIDRGLLREVEAWIRRDPEGDRVGAVILGTNIGLEAPIGDILTDQNVPGLHLSFGAPLPGETAARSATRMHLPMTCAYADVDVDGVALLRAGRYLVI